MPEGRADLSAVSTFAFALQALAKQSLLRPWALVAADGSLEAFPTQPRGQM